MTVRDETGLVVDYKIEGDFPRYGNDDDRADDIAVWLLKTFMKKIKKHHTYRNSEPTTSILTITSNVVYGKATGALPDGREAFTPFAPGANPAYGAEQNGLLASLNSVAKVPYEYALDGISNTQTINPGALGHSTEERSENLVNVLDGYFEKGAHHLNVNVFASGEAGVCELHDPCIRIRGQVHRPDKRAAARCHRENLPRQTLILDKESCPFREIPEGAAFVQESGKQCTASAGDMVR